MLGLRNIIWEKTDAQSILNALSAGLYDVNNDFNGENGDLFVSEIALNNGFANDIDYTKFIILNENAKTPMTAETIVAKYLAALFEDPEWYQCYKYEMIYIPSLGNVGVSVTWK